MIFVEDEPAWSTRQIENIMLCSFATAAQAQCADRNGHRYYPQPHVRRLLQISFPDLPESVCSSDARAPVPCARIRSLRWPRLTIRMLRGSFSPDTCKP